MDICGTRMTCPIAHFSTSLQWRHERIDGVSNHQLHDCLLNHLFRRWSKKTPRLRVAGFCAGNSPMTSQFPAQMASNAENVSIWWRHHGVGSYWYGCFVTWFCHQLIAKPGTDSRTSVTCAIIPALISNYIHYNMRYEITYPFLNFNGITVEV